MDAALRADLIQVAYLVAAFCFILGLRWLSSPRTARKGNLTAAVGMAIALVATIADASVETYIWIALAAVVGGAVGAIVARRVQMTAMPQLVALLNGLGGGAAALIALAEYHRESAAHAGESLPPVLAVGVMFSAIVGSISFSGSIVAFAKLQELLPGRPITWPGQKALNAVGAAAALGLAVYASFDIANPLLWVAVAIALVLGTAAVLPIGGADMPVVIAFLNACTGLAAAATGFMLDNTLLIIAGTLVGASGTLLTKLMGDAMNRSLTNVLFGAFGGGGAAASGAAGGEALPVLEISPSDLAAQLVYARRVSIVPGYGLAVAQAQHPVRELADLLGERGVQVSFAIHPVAGRMPGHMNVLLAEADVPYDQLLEMEEANPDFPQTDVVLVIGANDVVNPAARDDPSSPLHGMPILEVDRAENVIVFKRSMATGFAGIENMLFHDPKTRMLFGDARKSLVQLVQEVQAV